MRRSKHWLMRFAPKDVHAAACVLAIVAEKHDPHAKTVNRLTKNICDFGVRKRAELGIDVSRRGDFLLALFERDATGTDA